MMMLVSFIMDSGAASVWLWFVPVRTTLWFIVSRRERNNNGRKFCVLCTIDGGIARRMHHISTLDRPLLHCRSHLFSILMLYLYILKIRS